MVPPDHPAGPSETFSMQQAFHQAQEIFSESALLFAGLALVFGIPDAITDYAARDNDSLVAIFAMIVVASLFGAIAEAAITLGALRRMKGRAMGGDILATGLNFYTPIFVALLLGSLAAMFGLLLFILPGILVVGLVFFAVPAIVEEEMGSTGDSEGPGGAGSTRNPENEVVRHSGGGLADGIKGGIGGLQRSFALGAGNRGQIFLMVFLYIAFWIAVDLTLDYLLASAPLLAAFASWLVSGVIGAFGSVLAVTGYVQLRALQGDPLKAEPDPQDPIG